MKTITNTLNRLNLTSIILIFLLPVNTFASLNISLEDLDGNQHKLSEYIGQGKWVVLNIWGTRCPPCREEIPELVNYHDEHHDTDGIVVGIAIDFPSYGYAKRDEVAQFTDDYLIDFPVLLSDSNITEKIGLGRLEALPSTYIFNPSGNVVGMQIGGITQQIIENFIQKLKLQTSNSFNKQVSEDKQNLKEK